MRIATMILLGAGLAIATPVLAQDGAAKDNAAIKDVHTVNDGGARSGANSFTRQQAREHIANSGFTHVSMLAKDDHGVWRGTAHHGGHTVHVALDFKGNVSTGNR